MVADRLTDQRFRRVPGTIIEPLRGLDDRRAAEGFFGVVAVPGRPDPRLVDPDTALLLYSLDEPAPLPTFAAADLLRDRSRALLALIGEGLIEIEIDGSFVTGDAALTKLLDLTDADTPAARLNHTVMRHALRIASGQAGLREALYFANAEPASPAWHRRLADGSERWLGLPATGTYGAWATSQAEAWTMFRRERGGSDDRHAAGGWKMYFSPRAAELPLIVADIADAFDQCRAPQWKIGRDLQGLLRPDKVVGYFPNRTEIARAVDHFTDRFVDVAPHGVPFAVPADPTGLVSWGVDPKPTAATNGTAVSWRYALCDMLAGWLAGTDPDAAVADRVDHALRRSAAEGFDTETFEPPPRWLTEAGVTR